MNKSKLAVASMLSLLSLSALAANTNSIAPEKITLKMDFRILSCATKPGSRLPTCAVYPESRKEVVVTLDQCSSPNEQPVCMGHFTTNRQAGIYTFTNTINVFKHTEENGKISYQLNGYMGPDAQRNQEITLEMELDQSGKIKNSVVLHGSTLEAPQPDGSLYTYQPRLSLYSK